MLTFFAYANPYQQLAIMAKPTYFESGELEDGGFDLTTDGVCGYLHDVIYITGFVQLTTIISKKFWYIYLVILAFAAYKLLGFVKGFMSLGLEGPKEDEKSKKKREKMERKASRPKFARTTN
ncbi:Transmembrane protein 208 [Camellia lanceoleosa]|uniref:Transmembrane protein 208 n=1 Tax=Camellia lanceoleosa TaxID=1840588 RepID=A0ACC0H6G6_9ERIC|nr:Transmembrane protein 208 [Camellia lanceoleosa]